MSEYMGPNWEQRMEAQLMPDEQDRLIAILHGLVDGQDDDCSYDHHGSCQNHYGELGDFDCAVHAGREYLKHVDKVVASRLKFAGYDELY